MPNEVIPIKVRSLSASWMIIGPPLSPCNNENRKNRYSKQSIIFTEIPIKFDIYVAGSLPGPAGGADVCVLHKQEEVPEFAVEGTDNFGVESIEYFRWFLIRCQRYKELLLTSHGRRIRLSYVRLTSYSYSPASHDHSMVVKRFILLGQFR